MKKTELYNLQHQIHSLDITIWDDWVDWRMKNAGVTRPLRKDQEDLYEEVLSHIPEIYDWEIEKDHLRFTWVNGNGDGQEELVPLSVFVDDLDEQPDLTMLWHSNYYDGPLSGVAEYNGEMVWFDCEDYGDWGDDKVRSYALYRLTDEAKAVLISNHNDFREAVGHHCDHVPEQYSPFVCKNKEKFNEYYSKNKNAHKEIYDNLKNGEKLGVFAYHQFKYYARPR